MQEENIKTLTLGCRLNALESEKIRDMLSPVLARAIVVNTCAVTAAAERQSAQAVRKLRRENPDVPIFVTGCAGTLNPAPFAKIPDTFVVGNKDKLDLGAYLRHPGLRPPLWPEGNQSATRPTPTPSKSKLSKQFIQVQNGCNHQCAYCVTRLVRGKNVSFPYADILVDVKKAVDDGFFEIVLTGVDIASYAQSSECKVQSSNALLISDVCKKLLNDVPGIKRLRLSSMDPASPEIPKIIELMHRDSRMLPHIHLSMQSGSNTILHAMRRRHTADTVRQFVTVTPDISFSWDIICGFPGETDELFTETVELVRELKPIKIHAFPFSPRPGTVAADMPDQVDRAISKRRVKIISEMGDDNKREFMKSKLGTRAGVLVEENNIARTADDIDVKIVDTPVPSRTVCDVEIIGISDLQFIGKV